MKRTQRYLSLILLTAFAANASHNHSAKRKKTKIDTPLLCAIDGITGIMDANTFKDCYNTWNFVHGLQFDAKHATFKGKLVALKDLVIFEFKSKKTNLDINSSEWKEFLESKKQIIDLFIKNTIEKKRSVESSSAKESTKKIVDLWLSTQKDTHATSSLLKNWGTPQEETALYEASAEQLFRFMSDLRHFLEDFMYSCPKARADFESYLHNKEDRESFEKFFTND